jgi:hypothetical protein
MLERMGVRDISQRLVVDHEKIHIEEQRHVGLVRGASAVEAGAHGLDLVVRRGVSLACQIRRRHGTKLRRAFYGERSHRRQPRCQPRELDGGGPGWYEIVGRHSPGAVPPVKGGGGGDGKLPSLARKAIMPAAAAAPTATPGLLSVRL